MSGSFESGQWNACMHRQDLGLYFHPKELDKGLKPELFISKQHIVCCSCHLLWFSKIKTMLNSVKKTMGYLRHMVLVLII